MSLYQLEIPTRVYFGRNIVNNTLKKEEKLFQGNILIVTTGRTLIRLGYVDALKEELEKLPGVKTVTLYDKISANPQLQEIATAAEHGNESHIDMVVGFGGGSAIDAAKATAAVIGTGYRVEELFYQHIEPDGRTLPIVAIPTTAGTGSELSKAAIVSDNAKHVKGGIRGRNLYPTLAIVDSLYTETVPFQVTMETGFDVLAHAMESYVSKVSSPYTKMLSEQSVRIVGSELVQLGKDLSDVNAREKMSYASMIMGINLGNASTALPHRLQYPLGAHTGTSHGAGLAAMYPAWIYYEYTINPEKVGYLMELLTGERGGSARQAADLMKGFLETLHLPTSLETLGVTEAMLPTLTEEVSGNLANDQLAGIDDIVSIIYRDAMKGFSPSWK